VRPSTGHHATTVERGAGSTDAGAFAAGTEVLNQLPVSEGQIVERSCGQTASLADGGDGGPPVTALQIIASGTAWNKAALSAVAGEPLTIRPTTATRWR
jgi:hypothetical protein